MIYPKTVLLGGDPILKDYIEERAVEIANYIIESKATVREAAKVFKVSKSTVHTVLRIGVGHIAGHNRCLSLITNKSVI